MAIDAQPSHRGAIVAGPWSDPVQMQEVAAIVRLLTEIWTVPQVTKVAVATSEGGVGLWVFMAEDDYEAEGRISLAERDYLNAGSQRGFSLNVVPGQDIAPAMLPPLTILLER